MRTSDGWRRAMEWAAKFEYRYSFRNCILIAMQCPEATLVAGYRKWQEQGRQVKKGEKAIWILAPMTFKRETEDGDEERCIGGFRGVGVFDVSQTEGDDLPFDELTPAIEGDDENGIAAAAEKAIAERGFAIEEVDDLGRANGRTSFTDRVVQFSADLSAAHRAKTALHELAHIVCGHEAGEIERSQAELEAESVAYVVASRLGLEAETFSAAYLASWGGTADALLGLADKVVSTAKAIEAELVNAMP